jgi:hypothetical protein
MARSRTWPARLLPRAFFLLARCAWLSLTLASRPAQSAEAKADSEHASAEAAAASSAEARAEVAADADDEVLVRPFLQLLYAQIDLEAEDGDGALEFMPNATSNLELSYPFEVLSGRELNVTAFLHYHRNLSVTRPGTDRLLLPDAYITALGLDATLMLDPDFELDAVLGDFRPRQGSSGSWFLRSSLGSWFLGYVDQPTRRLVPSELGAGLEELAELHRLSELSLTLSGGYVVDWNIAGNLFLSALCNLGFAGSALALRLTTGSEDRPFAYGPSGALQLGEAKPAELYLPLSLGYLERPDLMQGVEYSRCPRARPRRRAWPSRRSVRVRSLRGSVELPAALTRRQPPQLFRWRGPCNVTSRGGFGNRQ